MELIENNIVTYSESGSTGGSGSTVGSGSTYFVFEPESFLEVDEGGSGYFNVYIQKPSDTELQNVWWRERIDDGLNGFVNTYSDNEAEYFVDAKFANTGNYKFTVIAEGDKYSQYTGYEHFLLEQDYTIYVGDGGTSGDTTPIENTISFSENTLTITAGTRGEVYIHFGSNKECQNLRWTASHLNLANQAILSIDQSDEFNPKLTIDARNLTNAENGEIRLQVEFEYYQNGLLVNYVDSWNYSYYVVRKPIVDSEPTISINPTSFEIEWNSTTSITASVSMTESIISTDFSINLDHSQLTYTTRNATTNSIVFVIDSSNVISSDEDNIFYITANVKYWSENGYEATKQVQGSVRYKAYAKKVTIPLQAPITFTPTSLSIQQGNTATISSKISSNKTLIDGTTWSVSVNGNVGVSLIQDDYYNTRLTVTTDNITTNEEGIITYTLVAKYYDENGLLATETKTYDYSYSVTINIPEDDVPILSFIPDGNIVIDKTKDESFVITKTAYFLTDNELVGNVDWYVAGYGNLAYTNQLGGNGNYQNIMTFDATNIEDNELGTITIRATGTYKSNFGGTKEYTIVKYIPYSVTVPEKPETPFEGNITFNPESLNGIAVGGIPTVKASIVGCNKTITSTSWEATPTSESSEVISRVSNQTSTSANIDVDTTQITNYEYGFIDVTANISYLTDNNEGATTAITNHFEYDFTERVDSAITLNIVCEPTEINMETKNVEILGITLNADKEITETVWSISSTVNGLDMEVKDSGATYCNYYIMTENMNSSRDGYITVFMEYSYKDNYGDIWTGSDSTTIYINITQPENEASFKLSLTPTDINVESPNSVNLTATLNIDGGTIQNTQWTVYIPDYSQLSYTTVSSGQFGITLSIDTSKATVEETGEISIGANVSYKDNYDNDKTGSITNRANYHITIPEPEEPEPEEPEEPKKGVLSSNKPILYAVDNLTITSTEKVVEWVIFDGLYNATQTTGETTNNISISLKNNLDIISTTLIVRAYFNMEKTLFTDISIPIIVDGNGVYPIYQNTYFAFNTTLGYVVNYTIEDNETGIVIYSGKANRVPNEDSVKINISKIVSNFLFTEFTKQLNSKTLTAFENREYSKTVNIKVNGEIQGTITLYNNWAYEDFTGYVLSAPIKRTIDRKQYLFCTLFSKDNPTTVAYRLKNGGSYLERTSVSINNSKSVTLVDNSLDSYPNYNEVEVGNLTYKIVDGCYEYCLYYSNAFGGWDSLLVGGNAIKTDKINSQYYSKQNEKTKYMNIITPSYVLHTDWFNDDEQSRLHHLLESNEVYLHNLKTNKIEPVVINNTSCEYKTYTNNGRKKWYNTINVEVANNKIRL